MPFFTQITLRNIGWLKPFIIGFTWAGVVTVYPALFQAASARLSFFPGKVLTLLFIKNFMFVSVLAILFDIKDYAMDYNRSLKTFVVKFGLRRTIFFLIIPLTCAGAASFFFYAFVNHFSALKIIINLIPFSAVLLVAWSLQSRRSILYYLFIIDGLMLLKGICGSAAMWYF